MPRGKGTKLIAQNRKAFHDYFIEDKYECGIELVGTEVKSIRGGKVNLKDSFARVRKGEVFVTGMHVSPYEMGNIFNRDPFRERPPAPPQERDSQTPAGPDAGWHVPCPPLPVY